MEKNATHHALKGEKHRMDIKIFNDRTDPNCFAVMLWPAPKFPDDRPWKDLDGGIHPYAIVAANDDTGAWGWVTLSSEEKDMIGQKLLDHCSEPGRWYWCLNYA